MAAPHFFLAKIKALSLLLQAFPPVQSLSQMASFLLSPLQLAFCFFKWETVMMCQTHLSIPSTELMQKKACVLLSVPPLSKHM